MLGIDTSGSLCSAAVVVADRVHRRCLAVGSAHSEHLLPMIGSVLREARIALADCAVVAYSAGPGSFTGLRVGCAVAQGLAFGAGLAVVPVSTLDVVASAVEARDGARLLVAQDARIGEVYWRAYRRDGARWTPVGDPAVEAAHALRERLATGSFDVGAGSAWSVHAEPLDGLVSTIESDAVVDARGVATLGLAAWSEGRSVPADRATLHYVRDRVALTTAERQARRDSPTAVVDETVAACDGRT